MLCEQLWRHWSLFFLLWVKWCFTANCLPKGKSPEKRTWKSKFIWVSLVSVNWNETETRLYMYQCLSLTVWFWLNNCLQFWNQRNKMPLVSAIFYCNLPFHTKGSRWPVACLIKPKSTFWFYKGLQKKIKFLAVLEARPILTSSSAKNTKNSQSL